MHKYIPLLALFRCWNRNGNFDKEFPERIYHTLVVENGFIRVLALTLIEIYDYVKRNNTPYPT